MKKVLWLASWYPNKLSRFDGDFLQRHAKAVALYCRVHVIYIVKDNAKAITKNNKVEVTVNGNLTEQVIYYSSFKTGIKIIDKFISQRRYTKLYRKVINDYVAANGKPDLAHVQIAMKAGLAALWMKRKWNIPFIVSEQWTGYLANADVRISDYPFIYRKWLQKVIEEASLLTVVSHHLGKAIQLHFPSVQYEVVPNVVDTNIFSPREKLAVNPIQLIHISNMSYQKNTEAILEALHLVKDKNSFKMLLYGSVNPLLEKLIGKLGLQDHVLIMGEVPQPELAKAIQGSDVLVLYSRFETFGCVLIEANACGIPVIVSDIEVFHELIEEGKNGIFVQENNPAALAEKLQAFMATKNNFNKQAIAEITAAKYNFKKVGQQFTELYNRIPAKL